MITVFKNARVSGKHADIVCRDGKIISLEKNGHGEKSFDLGGLSVYAGLVDIHIHGCAGFDVNNGSIREISDCLIKRGTTCWLPTLAPDALENMTGITRSRGEYSTAIPGFHLEGPYISPECSGALSPQLFRKPNIGEFRLFDNISMITVAPELENAMEFIKEASRDTVVSLGHTVCDYDTALAAIDNGARCITHAFNAMPPFHHRQPSLIGAALERDLFVQVICDGVHLHKSAVIALYRMFGPERMILISDGMSAAGMPDGEYLLGGVNMTVVNGIARTSDGALAGSTNMLLNCVRYAVMCGIPADDAFRMASRTPCELMGLNKGRLSVGSDADFIVVDDRLRLVKTIVNGRCAYGFNE